LGERKHIFVEDDITGDIHAIGRNMKAFIAFVYRAVTKEDTFFGAKLKFATVVGTKVWPTCTTKHFKESVVRELMKQKFKWCLHI
jgi:hypothetical protein